MPKHTEAEMRNRSAPIRRVVVTVLESRLVESATGLM